MDKSLEIKSVIEFNGSDLYKLFNKNIVTNFPHDMSMDDLLVNSNISVHILIRYMQTQNRA